MQTTIRLIGRTIKELRSRRGLTLEELANRSGCTPGFISQVERNQAVPSVTTLYAIASVLGVKVTDFFPDVTNPTRSCAGMNGGRSTSRGRRWRIHC